jgi:hypothetical protein
MRNANILMSVLLLSAVSISPVYANWSSNPRPSYSWNWVSIGTLVPMEGRTIYGADGADLGYVLAVDVHESLVQVQTRDGVAVALPARLVSNRTGQLRASTLLPLDMMAIAKQQTGRTVAINVEMPHSSG